MYNVDVIVLDAEMRDDQVAELSVDGEQFAFSRLLNGQVVIEITRRITPENPLILGAASLIAALERGREMLR